MKFNRKQMFETIHIELFPTVLFVSLIILYFYNPLSNLLITSFDRVMGSGLLSNVSVEKRIHKFYFWYLILLPCVFCAVYYLVNFIYMYSNKSVSFLFINDISSITLIPLAISFINRFNKFNLDFSILFGLCIVVLLLLYFLFKKYILFKFNNYKWCIFFSFSIVQLIFALLNFNQNNNIISLVTFIIFFIIFMLISIFIIFIINTLNYLKILNSYNFNILKIATIPIFGGGVD